MLTKSCLSNVLMKLVNELLYVILDLTKYRVNSQLTAICRTIWWSTVITDNYMS